MSQLSNGAAGAATGASAPTDGAESTTAASLAAIGSDLANSMPDVQEHAVQQARKEQESAETAPTDKNGDAFDPAVHVTGPDGKGTLTVRGTWAQKRGRKGASPPNAPASSTPSRSVLGGPAAPPSPQALQQQQQAVQIAQARAAGVAAAEMLFMAGRMFGGDEWAPMENKSLGLDERAMMHQAFGDYFVATGRTDIPPGAALSFCFIGYVGPRLFMPKTQSRMQKVKSVIVTWWVNRKMRKAGLVQEVRKEAPRDEQTKQ